MMAIVLLVPSLTELDPPRRTLDDHCVFETITVLMSIELGNTPLAPAPTTS